MHRNTKLAAALAVALAATYAPSAAAYSSYLSSCTGCHGQVASQCNACHAHGAHSDGNMADVNVAGTLNKTSFAPGETVAVTVSFGYRGGGSRVVLFDGNGTELARTFATALPVTLSASAPTTAGSHTWLVAWYGNERDAYAAGTAGSFGLGTSSTISDGHWTPDASNSGHGWQTVALPAFEVVAAPPAPAAKIAVAPTTLAFGTVNVGSQAQQTTVVSNTGNADLVVSSVARCSGTSAEFVASPASFTVPASGTQTVTVAYAPADAGTDTGCIAIASNDAAGTQNVSVSGAGQVVANPVVDVDIVRFTVPKRVDISRGGTATPKVSLVNNGTVAGTVTVSLTGAYAATQDVTIAPGQTVKVSFPEYKPTSASIGNVTWTVTVADQDPDTDTASAVTKFVP